LIFSPCACGVWASIRATMLVLVPEHVEIWPEDKDFPLTRVAKVDKMELQTLAVSIVEELRRQGKWDAGQE